MPSGSSTFDPYCEWLGIEPHEQPADFYRLLGVARFEVDAQRIAEAADQRMSEVRSYQTGPRGAYTQKLLNELASARGCLLSPVRKAQYDAELARRLMAIGAQRQAVAMPQADIVPNAPTVDPSLPESGAPIPFPPLMADGQRRSISRPEANWQPILLAAAVIVALLLAGGGWAFSRWTAGHRPAASAPSQKGQTTDRAATTTPPREIVPEHATGEILFTAPTATLRGSIARNSAGGEETLAAWRSPDDEASWRFRVTKPGFFKAELTYATASGTDDAVLELKVDERARSCSLRDSGGLDQFVTDTYTVAAPSSGPHTLTIRPPGHRSSDWLILKSVRFIPVGAAATP